ncbi:hypothetical protein HNV12_27680 [Methanococcoides sp. SA1]|nr:hypothetical protein [Methanococcoides sp. SA1]
MHKAYKIYIVFLFLFIGLVYIANTDTNLEPATLIKSANGNDTYSIKVGSTLDISNGYILEIIGIDLQKGYVWVKYRKDEEYINTEVIYINQGEKEYNVGMSGNIFRFQVIDILDYNNAIVKFIPSNDADYTMQSIPKDEIKTIPSEYDSSLVKDYEILETEDDSWKNAIRKQYRVLISTDVSKEELRSTLIQIVMDETSKNSDIDAISIFAYDRKEDVNGVYTLGTVDWCPNGNWGDVTSEIASSNDRSSYEYIFDIKQKVGNPTVTSPTKLEFEIYDYFLSSCDAEWDKIDLSDPYSYVDEDVVKQNVANHYGISVEKVNTICTKVVEYNYR